MALQASASIQINNFTDSLNCIISSDGSTFIDKNNGTTLICRLFNADEGEVDAQNESNQYQYYYFWQRNGEDWKENKVEGKILNITNSDLSVNTDAIVFSCLVYDKTTYDIYITDEMTYQESGSESDEEPQEPPMIAYGEINLDMTIKKWMTFDDQTGLWIRKTNGEWATLTDERGYHIYKVGSNSSISKDNWVGSFAEDSLVTSKVRLLTSNDLNEVNSYGQVSAIPTETYGWQWQIMPESDKTSLSSLFKSNNVDSTLKKYWATEVDSTPLWYYKNNQWRYIGE